MARRGGSGSGGWWAAGALAAGGAIGGAVLLFRRHGSQSAASPGTTVTVQTQPGTTIAPAEKIYPATQQTAGNTGITTSNPGLATPAAAGSPSTASTAPSVHGLVVSRLLNGNLVLRWTGTSQAVYQGDYGYGYDLFIKHNGQWVVLQAEVEPPLTVMHTPSGTVLGIAPVYLTPENHVISGQIRTVVS